MLQFSVEASGDLAGKEDALIEALREQTDIQHLLLQQTVVGKVSGDLLQVRSGKLARSVEMIPATVSGAAIEGFVQAGGGPAFYARFQDKGTNGPYQIVASPGKALAFMIDGAMMFRRAITHPGLKAVEFMSISLDESRDSIVAGLQGAVNEVASR